MRVVERQLHHTIDPILGHTEIAQCGGRAKGRIEFEECSGRCVATNRALDTHDCVRHSLSVVSESMRQNDRMSFGVGKVESTAQHMAEHCECSAIAVRLRQVPQSQAP